MPVQLAMIFGGSMVTMRSQFAVRTDLDTCEKEWDAEVIIDEEDQIGRCGIW